RLSSHYQGNGEPPGGKRDRAESSRTEPSRNRARSDPERDSESCDGLLLSRRLYARCGVDPKQILQIATSTDGLAVGRTGEAAPCSSNPAGFGPRADLWSWICFVGLDLRIKVPLRHAVLRIP